MKTKRIITEQNVESFFKNSINSIEDAMGVVILNLKTKEILFDFNSVLLLSFEGIYADNSYKLAIPLFDFDFKKMIDNCLSIDIKQDSELEYSRTISGNKVNFLIKLEKIDDGNKLKLYVIHLEKLEETEKQLSFFDNIIGSGTNLFTASTWWMDTDKYTGKFFSTDTGPELLGIELNNNKLYYTLEFQKAREKAKLVSEFYDESIVMEVESYEKVRRNETNYFGGRTPVLTSNEEIVWVESYGKCLIRYPDGRPRFSIAVDIYMSEIFDRSNQLEILRNLVDTGLISSEVGIWYYQKHFKVGRYYFTQSYQEMMSNKSNFNNETISNLLDEQIKYMNEKNPSYEHYLHTFRETHNKTFTEGLDKYHIIIPNYNNDSLEWIDVRGTVVERDENGEIVLFVGANVNVTESYNRNRELERLKIQNERLQLAESLAVKARNLMVWYKEVEDHESSRYIFGNDMFEEKLGIKRNSEGLISIKDLKRTFYIYDEQSKSNAKAVAKGLKDVLSGKINTVKKILSTHKNLITNEIIYLEHSVEVSVSPDNNNSRMVGGIMLDVTENILYQEKVKFLANYDVLTETYNRNYFEQYIKTRLPSSYTVLVFDLDGLKLTNDVFGHIEGDKIIRQTSEFLKKVYKDDFFISRIGGDEFVVLSRDTNHESVTAKANLLEALIEDYNKNNSIEMNISKGGLIVINQEMIFEKAFVEAENIMYRRKLNSRSSRKSKVLESILETLNAKTEETKEHSMRLGDLAVNTINALGLYRGSEVEDMILLAKVHDIGKITILDSILHKPDKLTKFDFEMIKKHCEAGYNIIRNITDSDRVCNGVLLHHERWDGKGYPQGLKGENIPLFARVINVVDAYDAMTNDRVYKKGIPHEKAVEEIIRCSGTQFDPNIVKAFLKSCFDIEL